MAKVTMVTCDCCKKDISGKEYQTVTIRAYRGAAHERVTRLPAYWLCNDCFKKMSILIFGGFENESNS